MSDFTVYEKMRCVERELRMRRAGYRNAIVAIERGLYHNPEKFNGPKAQYQIRCMQEIADEYRARWDGAVPTLNIDEGFMA